MVQPWLQLTPWTNRARVDEDDNRVDWGSMMTTATKRERTVLCLDVENAIGSRFVNRGATAVVMRALRDELGVFDAVIIGGSYGINALNAGIDEPGALKVLCRGSDGADRALQRQMLDPTTCRRFGRLVLVSSDGGFASALAACAARGMRTVVVPGASALSRRLMLAAQEVRAVDFGLHAGDGKAA